MLVRFFVRSLKHVVASLLIEQTYQRVTERDVWDRGMGRAHG
jgi:hypothetical protein